MSAVGWIVLGLVMVSVGVVLALATKPITQAVQERLRVDLERRIAEVRLQHITSEAMLQLMREQRRP